MADENLIGQNPRDSLLIMRQAALDSIKKERRLAKIRKAETFQQDFLKKFACKYLMTSNENVFDSLSKIEQDALARICARRCLLRVIYNSVPVLSVFGSFLWLGIAKDENFFAAALVSLVIGGFISFCRYIDLDIKFVWSWRRWSKKNKKLKSGD